MAAAICVDVVTGNEDSKRLQRKTVKAEESEVAGGTRQGWSFCSREMSEAAMEMENTKVQRASQDTGCG